MLLSVYKSQSGLWMLRLHTDYNCSLLTAWTHVIHSYSATPPMLHSQQPHCTQYSFTELLTDSTAINLQLIPLQHKVLYLLALHNIIPSHKYLKFLIIVPDSINRPTVLNDLGFSDITRECLELDHHVPNITEVVCTSSHSEESGRLQEGEGGLEASRPYT
jgi:hypothetical protein